MIPGVYIQHVCDFRIRYEAADGDKFFHCGEDIFCRSYFMRMLSMPILLPVAMLNEFATRVLRLQRLPWAVHTLTRSLESAEYTCIAKSYRGFLGGSAEIFQSFSSASA